VKIDISVTATDSDNINRSGETASFLIFVEPVHDAPEEVVRSSSPYLNGKDVRDATGVQLQLFDVDDVLLMNVEFSCPYGIFSIPPQITRHSALFVYTLKNSLEAEKVLSLKHLRFQFNFNRGLDCVHADFGIPRQRYH
jgi:hypothetical protein